MPSRRDLLSILAMVLADAAWLFPISGLFGLALGLGRPLLPLALIPVLIVVAIAVVWTVAGTVRVQAQHGPYQAVVGLAAIYLGMAIVAADLLWAPHMFMGEIPGKATAGLVIGTAAAGFLWFRGVGIAVESHPALRLLTTFRTGLVGLAVVILFEQWFDVEAQAAVMLVPFFVICLAGLAFTRLPSGGAWASMVGGAIAVVLGGGFVIGLIGAAIGGRGLDMVAAGWIYLTDFIAWLLNLILVPILSFLADLLPDFGGTTPHHIKPTAGNWDFLRKLQAGNQPPEMESLNRIIMYLVIAASVYGLYRLALVAYRAHSLRRGARAALERDSIRDGSNTSADLLKLALGLLPEWMLPGEAVPAPRIPQDQPGITEVYALYFDMLTGACDRGHEFQAAATPWERQSLLQQILPGAPVAGITQCFNAACYGHIPAAPGQLARLRDELASGLLSGLEETANS